MRLGFRGVVWKQGLLWMRLALASWSFCLYIFKYHLKYNSTLKSSSRIRCGAQHLGGWGSRVVSLKATSLDLRVKVILKYRLWNKEKSGPPLELPCFRNNDAGRFKAESLAVWSMLALGCSHRLPAGVLSWPFTVCRVFWVGNWLFCMLPSRVWHVQLWGKCPLASLNLVSYHLPTPIPPPPQPVFIDSEHVKVDLFPKDEDEGNTVESAFQASHCT